MIDACWYCGGLDGGHETHCPEALCDCGHLPIACTCDALVEARWEA